MADPQQHVTPRLPRERREISFAPFRLDLDAERLYRDDRPIPLRPKTFAVLRHLAEHPHVLITKDALLWAVWGGVAVTESTLTKSIGEIREALGDDPQRPRYLETVHRRGFRFLATVVAATPEATHATTDTAAIDRERELALLEGASRQAAAGERQIVFVTGEAGIGKTTLVTSFADGLRQRGGVWLAHGQCVRRHGEHEPYMPVLEALGRLAQQHGDAIVARLRSHAPSWLVQLPWLATPEELHDLRLGLAGTTRERMLRMFLQLTDALTTDAPLVLVLEDLHWADPSTLDLLTALAQRQQSAALLVVATYRPADSVRAGGAVDEVRRALVATRRGVELALGPLSRAGVGRYLATRFGSVATPELVRVLHEHTGGHPLFLVTATDVLLASGALAHGPAGVAATVPLAAIDASIPRSLRELVASQTATASARELAVLEAASVVGMEFAAAAVAAALDQDAVQVETICERLARSHRFLARADAPVTWPDGTVSARYAFLHAVYQRSLYDGVPPARRERLHRRVGTRLDAAHGDAAGTIAGEIAVHYEHGGEPELALRHLVVAAAAARARSAPRETARHAERALALLGRVPATPIRHRQELTLRSALVEASAVLQGFSSDDAWANYLRARELAADERDAQQLFQLLYAMFVSRIGRGDAATARTLAEELSRSAERVGMEGARLVARFADGYLAFFRGRHDEAGALDATRRRAPADFDGWFFGSNPVVLAGAVEGFRRWLVGSVDRARVVGAEAVAQARRQAQPINLCMALCLAAHVLVRRGDLDDAERAVNEGLALADEHGIGLWGPLHKGTQGMIQARRDELATAVTTIEAALRELRANGTRVGTQLLAAEVADVARRLGRIDEGLAYVADGFDAIRDGLDVSLRAELWRARGELLLARDPASDEALHCLAQATESARRDGALTLELRAVTALARWYAVRRRPREGADVLAPLLARMREGATTSDVLQAHTLLLSLLA